MTKRKLLLAVVLLGAAIFGLQPVFSQNEEKPKKPDKPGMPGMAEMAEMMKKYAAVCSPGEHHKLLGKFVGEWDTTTKMYMAGPGSPPMETHGHSKVTWALDKHFILEEFAGEVIMPDATGNMAKKPFKGMGLTGYDNYKNLYVGSWADTMGTCILHMAGADDPAGKVITCYGEMDEPMLDVHGRMVKYMTKIVSKKEHVFEIYDLHAGEGYKVMEITYTRSE